MRVTKFERNEKTGQIELHVLHDDFGNGTATTFENDDDLRDQVAAGSPVKEGPIAELFGLLKAVGADTLKFDDLPLEKLAAEYDVTKPTETKVEEKKK